MREGSVGKEPEYRRQQQAASERRENAQRQEQIISAVATLNARIDSIAAEHAEDRKQAERHEKKKSQRDWFTFAALVAAATAAIITLIVSHSDNRAIIRGAEDTEKRQLRAYVFVNEDEITELDNPTGPVTSIKITNSGRTPAYKLTHVLVYTNAIKYRHKESLPPVPTGEGSLSDLWPGGTHSKINQRRRITPLELAGLEAGDLVIYLYGEVRFTDAFSCQRWMRYKYLLGGPGAYRGLYLTIAEDGNETSDETAEDCLYEAPH